MERRGKIYKITNDINSKVYIGQTIQDVKNRFHNHCSKDDHNENMAIKRAIRKYGKEHFKIEIIEDNILKKNLDEREIYWIAYYKSNNSKFGYNLTKGGNSTIKENIFDEEQQIQFCNDYFQGMTIKDLSEKYNVTKKTVYRYLELNNLPLHIQNDKILKNRVNTEEFVLYIKSNYPNIKDVCEKFNICRCSVYNLIRKLKDENLKEGYNIHDLTLIFKTTKHQISSVLKENGIKIQRNKLSYEEYNISKSVQTQTGNAEG